MHKKDALGAIPRKYSGTAGIVLGNRDFIVSNATGLLYGKRSITVYQDISIGSGYG
jgi:hypothetical protein